MEIGMNTPELPSANELAVSRTNLAVQRNLMAADRTLMAWIRTALSMISFGFTIYKVLEGFQTSGAALPRPESPRNIGLFLTALGTFSMVIGTISYAQSLKNLRGLQEVSIWQPSFIMALIMSAMGLVLFFGIITRIL